MKEIIVRGMIFKILQSAAGNCIGLFSEYCDDDFLNFLRNNLPENLNKIPQIKEYIERMHLEFW